ncbi:MAG: anaerobic ribonucleoside-triphosphate reductase activating protein [Planctomycetota bacterium]
MKRAPSPVPIPVKLPVIRGFLPASLNEWDGRISAVLFLEGCNWRCPYCHGWRLVRDPASLPEIPIGEVLRVLEEETEWVDGVTITGGEPTLQPAIEALVELFHRRGLAVKLETNGSRPRLMESLIRLGMLDCLALDYKAPLAPDRLKRASGVAEEVAAVRRSFELAASSGLELEFHTTLCPACVSLEDLPEMGRQLARIAPRARWVLQRYNPEDVLSPAEAGSASYDLSAVEAAAKELRAIYPRIEVRGF